MNTEQINFTVDSVTLYSRAPVSTDSVSAVYRGPKKNLKLNK
jgi:hypothetical protein